MAKTQFIYSELAGASGEDLRREVGSCRTNFPSILVPTPSILVPSYSSWFSPDRIHHCEVQFLTEFFDLAGPPLRGSFPIVSQSRAINPSRKLTFTETRKPLVDDQTQMEKFEKFRRKPNTTQQSLNLDRSYEFWVGKQENRDHSGVGKDQSVLRATSKTKKQNKPAALLHKSVMKQEFGRMAKGVANQVADNHYRPDLKKAALARLKAVHKSLKIAKSGVKRRNRQAVRVYGRK